MKHRYARRAGLLAAALTASMLGPVKAEENILKNGGFEEGALEPWEWFVAGGARAKGNVDTEQKHGGESSYLIHNESSLEPNVYGQLRQYANGLKTNTTYILTAWVKGKDVSGAQLALGPGWKTIQALPSDTFDWTKIEKEFTTDDSPEKYDIVFIAGSTTGALWIDDVKVEEAGGTNGASLFQPSLWNGLSASARFFPIYASGSANAETPVVSLRSETSPSFGGEIRISRSRDSLFF